MQYAAPPCTRAAAALACCMAVLMLMQLVEPAACKKVHVVFGNHLDIGFDNIEPLIGYDDNVINKYFHEYLPLAVDVSDEMRRRQAGGNDHHQAYVYTTHSYLISLFLDCPPGMGLLCPNATTRAKVLRGIRSGAITWHAHPHNAQYEVYDTSLLGFSFDLTHDLDRRFGLPPKHTAILRDVPGLTRAAIPVFAAKGIRAISVGVNPGSAPPGVPRFTPFIWRDEASGTEVLAFWRPGGYGGVRETVNLDPPHECIQAPGLGHVLCTSWRNDNAGPPPDAQEPLEIYHLLRQEWAGSDIVASSFDAFVDAVLAALPQLDLPVVTGEIGDTWVFGVQSDPRKVAQFRAASRLRAACIADPACPSEGPAFHNFSRLLLKVPEHTWGVDIKKTLHDFEDYSNARLFGCIPPRLRPPWAQATEAGAPGAAAGAAGAGAAGAGAAGAGPAGAAATDAPCPNYGHCLKAWERQAAYVDWALQALPPSHPVVTAFAADRAARNHLASISYEELMGPGQSGSSHAAGPLTPPAASSTSAGRQGPRTRQLQHAMQPQGVQMRPGSQALAAPTAVGGKAAGEAAAGQQEQQQQQQRRTRLVVPASSRAVHQYTCGGWSFEVDGASGGLTSLRRLYEGGTRAGNDWAGGSVGSSTSSKSSGGSTSSSTSSSNSQAGVLAQLVYNAYTEASYDVVWDTYAWQHPLPWWFPLDFGKVNSSHAWAQEVQATAKLEALYETTGGQAGELQQLALRHSFPANLVRQVGAPATMWTIISCPGSSDMHSSAWPHSTSSNAAGSGGGAAAAGGAHAQSPLNLAVVWQDKTPTRIPEGLWLSFRPAPGAVDTDSWRLHKLGSTISPLEVIRNGSHNMHAVSDAGVSVRSAGGGEVLHIHTWDAALVSPGAPTPFPVMQRPDMSEGVHVNLANNVWGTNYVMWVPYSIEDRNLAFRFSLHAERRAATASAAA